jgi:hypothetical protein
MPVLRHLTNEANGATILAGLLAAAPAYHHTKENAAVKHSEGRACSRRAVVP